MRTLERFLIGSKERSRVMTAMLMICVPACLCALGIVMAAKLIRGRW